MPTPQLFSTTITCPFDFRNAINIKINPHDQDGNEIINEKPLTNGDVANPKSISPANSIAPAKSLAPALLATKLDDDEDDAPGAISIPSGFKIHSADRKLDPRALRTFDKVTTHAVQQDPPLGVLSNFTGHFHGTGFNTIFRPNSGSAQRGTTFPNPVSGNPIPQPPNENVLELNLTQEDLTFSNPLGDVPNRGLEEQGDIHLNGVPYVQSISDVANILTGKADGKAQPIHFEPGLWMHVPATSNDPVEGESLVRMASIPHGTTINAQCLIPSVTVASGPIFETVDITPFPIGHPEPENRLVGVFHALDATRTDTPRLPQDLTKFIAEGTITQDMLKDPNTKLRNDIVGQKITSTIVFKVSTIPTTTGAGGGTANISFLQGAPSSKQGPNAVAADVEATFWIETVQYTLVVPPFKPGQHAMKVSPALPHPGAIVPHWEVTPPYEIKTPKSIVVTATQIQYSQNVSLNFAGLTWPHVSVATLVPAKAQTVPDSAWK